MDSQLWYGTVHSGREQLAPRLRGRREAGVCRTRGLAARTLRFVPTPRICHRPVRLRAHAREGQRPIGWAGGCVRAHGLWPFMALGEGGRSEATAKAWGPQFGWSLDLVLGDRCWNRWAFPWHSVINNRIGQFPAGEPGRDWGSSAGVEPQGSPWAAEGLGRWGWRSLEPSCRVAPVGASRK